MHFKKKLRARNLPEFELGEAANEGLKLVGAVHRQRRPVERLKLRIHHRREESNQEVQHVDPQPVGHDVEPLQEIDPQHVDCRHRQGPQPPADGVGRRSVEVMLESTGEVAPPLRQRDRSLGAVHQGEARVFRGKHK